MRAERLTPRRRRPCSSGGSLESSQGVRLVPPIATSFPLLRDGDGGRGGKRPTDAEILGEHGVNWPRGGSKPSETGRQRHARRGRRRAHAYHRSSTGYPESVAGTLTSWRLRPVGVD